MAEAVDAAEVDVDVAGVEDAAELEVVAEVLGALDVELETGYSIWKSYTSSRFGPPHISLLLPLQIMLH